MKKFLIITGLFLAFQSMASAAVLEWSDLELFNQYTLNQTISFPGLAEIHAGEKFEMIDVMAGGPPLIYYQMHLIDCKDPDATSEMTLINPSPGDHDRDRSIGAMMEEGCNISIWVEARDYYSKSLFAE